MADFDLQGIAHQKGPSMISQIRDIFWVVENMVIRPIRWICRLFNGNKKSTALDESIINPDTPDDLLENDAKPMCRGLNADSYEPDRKETAIKEGCLGLYVD